LYRYIVMQSEFVLLVVHLPSMCSYKTSATCPLLSWRYTKHVFQLIVIWPSKWWHRILWLNCDLDCIGINVFDMNAFRFKFSSDHLSNSPRRSTHSKKVKERCAWWTLGWTTARGLQLLMWYFTHSWALKMVVCTVFPVRCHYWRGRGTNPHLISPIPPLILKTHIYIYIHTHRNSPT
jgi:hypothetical protein